MNFKHQHFHLDSKSGKVFDVNGKELHLTGNAFRVLVFLCENGPATLADIGDHLDRAKDYDENHVRQYRYKINMIIGSEVVKYKNSVYSIVGDLEKIEKSEQNDRNTDLLHRDDVESEYKNTSVDKPVNLKFTKTPAIIAIAALLLTFIDWHSYGYYTIMKFIVTGTTAYYAYYIYAVKGLNFWFWGAVAIAILFNPFIPVYLRDKSVWMGVDVLVIGFLVGVMGGFGKKEGDGNNF